MSEERKQHYSDLSLGAYVVTIVIIVAAIVLAHLLWKAIPTPMSTVWAITVKRFIAALILSVAGIVMGVLLIGKAKPLELIDHVWLAPLGIIIVTAAMVTPNRGWPELIVSILWHVATFIFFLLFASLCIHTLRWAKGKTKATTVFFDDSESPTWG